MLAGRAGREPHPPAQPGGAGDEAAVPALAGVELADEVEQACGRGVEVRGQLGDLVAQLIQREHWHGESPFCWGDSTPRFWSILGGAVSDEPDAIRNFLDDATRSASERLSGPLDGRPSSAAGVPPVRA